MKSIARFVTRSARSDEKVDLILGSAFTFENYLKPNHVYEIIESLGEVTIKCIGPSTIKNPGEKSNLYKNWGHSVNEIINTGNEHLLTESEFNNLTPKER